MKTITYYGQFSLIEWIKLIVSKNIIIPEYQRSFVWNENDVSRLIYSIKNNQFVPPITIAQDCKNNLIIDGQQRLTAILLSYFGYFPIKDKWSDNRISDVNEDDSDKDFDNNDNVSDDFAKNNRCIKWTFREIVNNIKSVDDLNGCFDSDGNYKKIKLEYSNTKIKLVNDFFENNFLGFSYIVPIIHNNDNNDKTEIQKLFTQTFRNINYFGVKLMPEESRRSLYYLNKNYVNYFDGRTEDGKDVFCNIGIKI